MNLTGHSSPREVKITLSIWAVLLVIAMIILWLLKSYTSQILEHIYFVNVSRGSKSAVIYAEAENEVRTVLEKAEKLNSDSSKKKTVPLTDPHVKRAMSLYDEALQLDQRPEFDPGRTEDYELLSQLMDVSGQREGQLLTAARAFISAGNHKDARDYIAQASALTSGTAEPQVLSAQLDALEGNTSQALATLASVETSSPLSAKGHWVRSTLSMQSGDLDAAIADLQKALDSASKNLTYRRDLGVALFSAGKQNEAVKVMQSGLADGGWLDPAYLHVYGDYLSTIGDLDEAIRILKQADELAPNSGDVQWSLAKAYYKAGKTRQAASAQRRAVEIKPELFDKVF